MGLAPSVGSERACAEAEDEFPLGGAAGRGDGAAQAGRELDDVAAHAAGPAGDEDPLARLEGGVVDQRLPRGQRRQRQGGRFDVRDRSGSGREVGGGQRDVLRRRPVAVEVDQPVDLLIDRYAAGAGAEADDRARHLVGRDGRRAVPAVARRPGLVPGQFREGDRGGVHLDQGLARPGFRGRGLLVDELLGSAAGMRSQRHHRRLHRIGAPFMAAVPALPPADSVWPTTFRHRDTRTVVPGTIPVWRHRREH